MFPKVTLLQCIFQKHLQTCVTSMQNRVVFYFQTLNATALTEGRHVRPEAAFAVWLHLQVSSPTVLQPRGVFGELTGQAFVNIVNTVLKMKPPYFLCSQMGIKNYFNSKEGENLKYNRRLALYLKVCAIPGLLPTDVLDFTLF